MVPGGIGEEDIVRLVLPYIRSAREGVARLGLSLIHILVMFSLSYAVIFAV